MTILIPGKMYTFSQLYLTYENIDKFEREGNSGVIYSDEPFVLVKIADRPLALIDRIYTGKVHRDTQWVKILRCDSEAKEMLVWVAAIPESFISA
jgi:hypothetical protein